MIKYEVKELDIINENNIDLLYKDLLSNKVHFIIVDNGLRKYVLTKEKSIFEIDNVEEFIEVADNDVFYKTEFVDNDKVINIKDLALFKRYIEKYRNRIERTLYNGKYLFGSIAVRTNDDEFITTIRGKENLEDYTIVKEVNHNKHTVYVSGKKATLNAPLLDILFKNKDVKVIVHINHEFDNTLPYNDYALPGTARDSIRNNESSFNIKYHGLFYLINSKDEIIKKEGAISEIS